MELSLWDMLGRRVREATVVASSLRISNGVNLRRTKISITPTPATKARRQRSQAGFLGVKKDAIDLLLDDGLREGRCEIYQHNIDYRRMVALI